MSEVAVQGGRAGWRSLLGAAGEEPGQWRAEAGLGARRALQLGLAGIWLLDGVLQYQPAMYTKAFGQMLAGTAAGNPSVVAGPITWQANLLAHHLASLNTVFATFQLLLGLGIAVRPTARIALAGSVAWSLAVWWFGEGLGGVLSGGASPLNGAPGAAILYALLAVLLWPADRGGPAPFLAARAVGVHVARALWLVLWLSLAYFALTPGNRAPGAVSGTISGMAEGEPRWLSFLMRGAASLVTGADLATSIALAVALVVIAVGVYWPASVAKGTLVLAIVVSVMIWVVAEALGAILAGGATDPNSGPLLILLALAYWPARTVGRTTENEVAS
jgi:hypothetical protein